MSVYTSFFLRPCLSMDSGTDASREYRVDVCRETRRGAAGLRIRWIVKSIKRESGERGQSIIYGIGESVTNELHRGFRVTITTDTSFSYTYIYIDQQFPTPGPIE